jgi:dienelactone hydrolase
MCTLLWFCAGLVAFGSLGVAARAEAPRALPGGALPQDQRLQPLKDLDGYFPFSPSSSPQEWAKRAEQVRRQMRVALGLWPAPSKTPLNAVVHGRVDRPDYTVEKVYFESVPGFFVTGNLYRPKGKTGRVAGVLCPHGHWDNGRFMDQGLDHVRQEIVQGAERFEEGGRSVLQARCVQLARMGCVVFHYDMIGYADSQQISLELAHRFAKQRPDMNTVENWGLFSPQAEAHLQSVMGLQTWNSIRALDFLLSLPEIDPDRIAVTGASGGGTQTFVLCGLDPRPAAAFPAVMVSTAMQGGCTCENASLLRVETGNVEFAALFAPKPLGMTAANDWTKEMPSKGFPELKQHFAMMGAPENVMLKPLIHFEHNYNYVSRAVMYGWLNKQLKLGWREPVVEEDYKRLSKEEMSVWDDRHPKPEGGPEFERSLLRWLTADADKQLRAAGDSLEAYRQQVGGAVDVLIGRNLAEAGEVVWDVKTKEDRGAYLEVTGLLRNTSHNEELPVVLLQPKKRNAQAVIWADDAGKAGLFNRVEGAIPQLKVEIQKLLEAGVEVVGVDLLYQGEFLKDGQPLTRTPRVKNPREAAAFTFGYNRAVFAERVQDLLSVVSFVRNQELKTGRLGLVGLDGTGPLVAAARAQARDAIDCAALHTGGFRFGHVLEIQDVNFLPGGAKYGDIPGMLALGAPGRLWLAGEAGGVPDLVKNIYGKASAADHVVASSAEKKEAPEAAVTWLLSNL